MLRLGFTVDFFPLHCVGSHHRISGLQGNRISEIGLLLHTALADHPAILTDLHRILAVQIFRIITAAINPVDQLLGCIA